MKRTRPITPRRNTRRSSALDPRALVQRVLATVDSIPPGRVAAYGGVADQAGLPKRARFVGRVLRELPDGSPLPWHRVVNASGAFGLRGSAAAEQRRRLKREGVEFDSRGRVLRAQLVFAKARSGGGDESR